VRGQHYVTSKTSGDVTAAASRGSARFLQLELSGPGAALGTTLLSSRFGMRNHAERREHHFARQRVLVEERNRYGGKHGKAQSMFVIKGKHNTGRVSIPIEVDTSAMAVERAIEMKGRGFSDVTITAPDGRVYKQNEFPLLVGVRRQNADRP
jgi:hypothetical protein